MKPNYRLPTLCVFPGDAWQLEEEEEEMGGRGRGGRPSGHVDEALFSTRIPRHYFHSSLPSHHHTITASHHHTITASQSSSSSSYRQGIWNLVIIFSLSLVTQKGLICKIVLCNKDTTINMLFPNLAFRINHLNIYEAEGLYLCSKLMCCLGWSVNTQLCPVRDLFLKRFTNETVCCQRLVKQACRTTTGPCLWGTGTPSK